MNITEEMLIAFADGELDPRDRETVMRAVAADPELGQKLAAHQRLRTRLSEHFEPLTEEPVPDRLKALLVQKPGSEDDNVVSLASVREGRKGKVERERRNGWLPGWGNFAAIAATLVLGLAVGQSMNDGSPVGIRGSGLVAQGNLAKVLDTRLASAQEPDPETRIGLTFRSKGGEICRTFDGAAMAGLACREAGRWRLEQLLPGASAGSDYRQASAADPRIAASVQGMIAGVPFDAQAEKAALDEGWQD